MHNQTIQARMNVFNLCFLLCSSAALPQDKTTAENACVDTAAATRTLHVCQIWKKYLLNSTQLAMCPRDARALKPCTGVGTCTKNMHRRGCVNHRRTNGAKKQMKNGGTRRNEGYFVKTMDTSIHYVWAPYLSTRTGLPWHFPSPPAEDFHTFFHNIFQATLCNVLGGTRRMALYILYYN